MIVKCYDLEVKFVNNGLVCLLNNPLVFDKIDYTDDKGRLKVAIVVVPMRSTDFGIHSITGSRFVCLRWGMRLCIHSAMY